MNRRFVLSFLVIAASLPALTPALAGTAARPQPTVIVSPCEASWMEKLAAREVRRYVYLRTGSLLPRMTEQKGALP